MDTIVEEKGLAFKELEKEIFRVSCQADMEITRQILEQKDEEIFRACDKAVYHSEGFRKTSIKTVYGTVEYRRRVYRTRTDDGDQHQRTGRMGDDAEARREDRPGRGSFG